MQTETTRTASQRMARNGWSGSTSALGNVTLALLAFGAAALVWKQLPDLRRYMNIRSM